MRLNSKATEWGREVGLVMQRLLQLRKTREKLKYAIEAIEEKMSALERQYLELANIHGFEDIDPIASAVVPREDKVQTGQARQYRLAALASVTFGTGVAACLSFMTFNLASATLLFVGCVVAALLMSVIVIGIMRVITNANPRNPEARRNITHWTFAFGAMTLVSAASIAWLRFVTHNFLLEQVSLFLVGFEAGLFCLGGAFECLRSIYSWSHAIAIEYEHLQAQRDFIRVEHATTSVDLDDLKFRLSQVSKSESGEPEGAAESTKEKEEALQ